MFCSLTFISHNGFQNFLPPGRIRDLNPSLQGMFMQQDHVIFFKDFKLCAPDGSRRLMKRSAMPCHSYSGQQQHMINKRPVKHKKNLSIICQHTTGIIFSVLIKY
jgi:hypothetical protein